VEDIFVTITGLYFYSETHPFSIDSKVILEKEPDNQFDNEAISVRLPLLGKSGYVANSTKTVIKGCKSAGRIYDKIPDKCIAQIKFIGDDWLIAQILL
jgi:hypothetical protein